MRLAYRFRCRFLMVVAVWGLLSLAHCGRVTAEVQTSRTTPYLRRTQFTYTINNELEGATYDPPPRVIMDPFRLMLSHLDAPLSDQSREVLLETMETVATNFLRDNAGDAETPALQYVKFGGIEQEMMAVDDGDDQQLMVNVDVGVASYESHPTPSHDQVQEWVEQALASDLAPFLQTIPEFSAVRSVRFALQSDPIGTVGSGGDGDRSQNGGDNDSSGGEGGESSSVPTSDPSVAETTPATANESKATETEANTAASSKRRRRGRLAMWIILGISLALFSLGVLFLGVAKCRRRRELQQAGGIVEEIKAEPLPASSGENAARGGLDTNGSSHLDTRSVAESESEWTVATEAGDSMAIKSIPAGSILAASGAAAGSALMMKNNTTSAELAMSESFERDRQVAISKDMLTGKWSGNLTNPSGKAAGNSESVLQPSHFTAATEEQEREARAAATPDLLEASSMGSSSTGDDDDSNSSSGSGSNKRPRCPHPPDDDDE